MDYHTTPHLMSKFMGYHTSDPLLVSSGRDVRIREESRLPVSDEPPVLHSTGWEGGNSHHVCKTINLHTNVYMFSEIVI